MSNESSPCDLPSDLFLDLLLSHNDVNKALELIKVCGKHEEFNENPNMMRIFCNYYNLPLPVSPFKQLEESIILSDEEMLQLAIKRCDRKIVESLINSYPPGVKLKLTRGYKNSRQNDKFIQSRHQI